MKETIKISSVQFYESETVSGSLGISKEREDQLSEEHHRIVKIEIGEAKKEGGRFTEVDDLMKKHFAICENENERLFMSYLIGSFVGQMMRKANNPIEQMLMDAFS